jgi:ATP-dependent helicase HrpA
LTLVTPSRALFSRIEALLPRAMIRDRQAAAAALAALRRSGVASAASCERLARLAARLEASAAERERRAGGVPALDYPPELPITARRPEIVAAVRRHPVVIVAGETGSGKSTQLPKMCLEAGCGIGGVIGHTQPRRIAAAAVARRIAEELGQPLGGAVGFKIRFTDRTSRQGYIKLMTDGVLLAETQSDPWLGAYDALIVDEAHERSLNIDVILGLLRRLLERRRDLKVVITSATIDTAKFSQAFGGAPVVTVSGRSYPVEVRYRPPEEEPERAAEGEPSHVELAVRAVAEIEREGPFGDVLVFMPTEQDIRDTCELLAGRGGPPALVLPLYARLAAAEQARVFRPAAGRRIIVATNVAETALTIPGIRFVVDTGLARERRYSPRTRTAALPVVPIAQSSAEQRKGRAGRTQGGVCIRLYSEEDFRARPAFTRPEILRANLAEVILRLVALGLGAVEDFPFIDRPDARSIRDGFSLLVELGAIAEAAGPQAGAPRERTPAGGAAAARGVRLTTIGRQMARMPLDPRLARMLIAAREQGCVAAVAVIAAALSIQDPRERPAEKTAEADRAHAAFRHPGSDFLTYLVIWERYQALRRGGAGRGALKRFCRDHFLSARRMGEWEDVHRQIEEILAESGDRPAVPPFRFPDSELRLPPADCERIHRAVLAGFLANIAAKKEAHLYRAAKGREAMIFPGSGLFGAPPAWIVAAELVETSRLFARTAAAVEPDWIEAAGAGLCRSSYSDPRWDPRREQVVATEQVTLFGLVLVPARTVAYDRIDPEAAGEIFVRRALVGGEIRREPGFLRANRELAERLRGYEERLRRRDLVADDEALVAFYRARLPGICDPRSLSRLIRERGGDGFLRLREDDLLRVRPDPAELERFPETVAAGGGRFACRYRFAPGREEDGVTLAVPAAAAGALSPPDLDWLVPGLLRERIEAMLRALPRDLRRRIGSLAAARDLALAEMPRGGRPLAAALAEFLRQRFGLEVSAALWPPEAGAERLRLRLEILSADGRPIASGRDPQLLRRPLNARGIPEEVRGRWERRGLATWDCGELPRVVQNDPGAPAAWAAFPALVPAEAGADLKLFSRRDQAEAVHPRGVAALCRARLAGELKRLQRGLSLPEEVHAAARAFGGARALEAAVIDRVVAELFAADVRTPAEFDALTAAGAARLGAAARELLYAVIPVLAAHAAARAEMAALARMTGPGAEFRRQMEAELARLLPPGFVELYARGRMPQLVRFLRAFAVRVRRAALDLEKDRAKAAAVAGPAERLKGLLATLSPDTSEEKRRALEELFWMIEEYKVAVFAPEVGTPAKVSPKRLNAKIAAIERLA